MSVGVGGGLGIGLFGLTLLLLLFDLIVRVFGVVCSSCGWLSRHSSLVGKSALKRFKVYPQTGIVQIRGPWSFYDAKGGSGRCEGGM